MSQEALAKLVGVTYQSVQEWERENGTAPSRKRQKAVADALGVSVPELLTGTTSSRVPMEWVAHNAKEEIALLLFRGLIPLQQAQIVQGMRALIESNRITRKFMPGQQLRGVSNDDVERAFGKVPPLTKQTAKRIARDLGDAMGDFLDE